MSLRLKTIVVIAVLGLISILIAGMYIELIASVVHYDHPQVSVISSRLLQGAKDQGEGFDPNLSSRLPSQFTKGRLTADTGYPPPPASVNAGYPTPAAPGQFP